MYQRIILENNNFVIEAADTTMLPAVLNITQNPAFSLNYSQQANKKSFNSRIYSEKTGEIKTVAESNAYVGSIGHNNFEFNIDFYFNKYAENQNYITDFTTKANSPSTLDLYNYIKNDDFVSISRNFLLDNFVVLRLNDYSYQAMTQNHYDYDIQVFYNGNKFPQSLLTIIKSYTYKKAWVLIDKTILNLHNIKMQLKNTQIIIDFKYKKFINESINPYYNIAGLYLPIEGSSPYYDVIKYKAENNTNYVLHQQSSYFDLNPKPQEPKIEDLNQKLLINNYIKTDVNKFQFFITKDINKYHSNTSYIIYKYTKSANDYLDINGKRILFTDNNELQNKEFYEVFPIGSNFIHYVFEYSDDSVTVDKLKKSMENNNIYLYNYDIKNIFTFELNGTKYIETIIPIPYDGMINKTIISSTIGLNNFKYNIELKYNGSFYDPSNLDSNNLVDENKLLPYFKNDSFIKSVAGVAYVQNINSESSSLLKFRNNEVNDFDIRTYIESNPNIIISIKDPDQYTYRDDALVQNEKIDTQFAQICSNLYNLIPNSSNENHETTTKLNMTDCLFTYFESKEKYVRLIKHDSKEHSWVYYLKPTNGKFIIPSSPDLVSIETEKSYKFYKVY